MVRLRLQELAEQRGLNMSQVQRQSGLTMGMVRRYWRNETTQVSLEALGMLARLFNIPPGELLSNVVDEPSETPGTSPPLVESSSRSLAT